MSLVHPVHQVHFVHIPRLLIVCAGLLLSVCCVATAAQDNTLTEAERKAGWILLFDGKSLADWRTSDWKMSRKEPEDGAINPHRSGHYMLLHKRAWTNFVLALDFKISKGCNSGIFIREYSLTPRPMKDVGYNGLEIAIDDTTGTGYHETGALYDLVRPTRNAMKPAGEWNHMEVTCNGALISVVLNGEKVTEADLDQFIAPNRRPDGSEHKFDAAFRDHPRSGFIGLQDHGSPCWYKNIKLRPLR